MTVPNPPMTGEYTNYYLNESNRQLANDNATQRYNQAKLSGESEDRALAQAKFAWQQTMDRAGLTGRFEDQWTMPTQQWFTSQFGTWMPGGPQAGQQTLENLAQQANYLGTYGGTQTQQAQQQAFAQAQQLAAMYGSYLAPGQTPGAGTQTQAAQEQAFRQDLANRQLGLDTATQQQAAANQYLTLLSNLRGPADWAKYQEVLNAGGNMNNLAAMAMGQYIPGGGATSGVQPQAANLNTLYGQVSAAGQPGYGQQPGGAYGVQQNLQALQGGGVNQAQQPQQAGLPNAAGNGTNMMGAPRQNQMNLPAPNQVAPQAWKNMTPSQQDMAKGEWEAQGWYKPDVEALMNQALPKYGANAPSAGTWRLR